MKADFVGLGYCSNDHLAVLPFIPMDTKVQMLKHAILGGGPSANSTAGAAAHPPPGTGRPPGVGQRPGEKHDQQGV